MSRHIMIVEDNDSMRLGMEETLKRDGYRVDAFGDPAKAFEAFQRMSVPLVITDLKMDGMDGMQLLARIKEAAPQTEVVIVSAFGTIDSAVDAMKDGAADFLTKPFSTEELRVRVERVYQRIDQAREIARLMEEKSLLEEELFEEMIGISTPMKQLFKLIQTVAKEDSTILIEGESGTGKELAARAIHQQSMRAGKPFVKLNCGALQDSLLESELFGHEKGAFTGAHRQKKGRFELADGGTLFLDEIGDISPAMQVKLLRVLQEQEFERVGGEETISVDVRIICATHRDLARRIGEGEFREDLYYRLSVIPLKIPSLRERKEDIPALVRHFLARNKRGDAVKTIAPAGIELLMQYSWPGNIRELENLVERLRVISPTDEIDAGLIAGQLSDNPTVMNPWLENLPLEEAVNAFERNLIVHALKKSDGVKNRAAKLLGVRTSTLYYKLEKYDLL